MANTRSKQANVRARERGNTAEESLARLKRAVESLVREHVGGNAASVAQAIERRSRAPRFGLSRERALDLLLELGEAIGAAPSYARLLRGTAEVVGERGVEATTVEDILAAADLSRRTFYQFFPDRTGAVEALLDLFLSVWSATAEAVAVGGTPADWIWRTVRADVGTFVLAGPAARVLVGEALRPGTHAAARFERFLDERAAALTSGKRAAQRVRARVLAGIGALLALGVGPESSATEVAHAEQLLDELWAGARHDLRE